MTTTTTTMPEADLDLLARWAHKTMELAVLMLCAKAKDGDDAARSSAAIVLADLRKWSML